MSETDKERLADEAKTDAKAASSSRELSDTELASVAAGVKADGPTGGTGSGDPSGGKKIP